MTTREFNFNNSIEFLMQGAAGLNVYTVIAEYAADELHMKEDQVKAFMETVKNSSWTSVTDLHSFHLWFYINYILPVDKKYNIAVTVPEDGSYDGTKIRPVKVVKGRGDQEFIEPCDPDAATFYSVYLHHREGGDVCVADCTTQQAAQDFEYFIHYVIKHLQIEK